MVRKWDPVSYEIESLFCQPFLMSSEWVQEGASGGWVQLNHFLVTSHCKDVFLGWDRNGWRWPKTINGMHCTQSQSGLQSLAKGWSFVDLGQNFCKIALSCFCANILATWQIEQSSLWQTECITCGYHLSTIHYKSKTQHLRNTQSWKSIQSNKINPVWIGLVRGHLFASYSIPRQ